MNPTISRRDLLGATAGMAAWAFTPYTFTANAQEQAAPKSPNDRLCNAIALCNLF